MNFLYRRQKPSAGFPYNRSINERSHDVSPVVLAVIFSPVSSVHGTKFADNIIERFFTHGNQ